MKRSAIPVLTALLLCAVSTYAADPIQPRKAEVSTIGQYIPVSVDGYATHASGATFPDTHVTISNIPFDLVSKPGADNFFLKSAGWPDWEKDPSSYYAAYDKGPEKPGDPHRPMFKIPVADYAAVY